MTREHDRDFARRPGSRALSAGAGLVCALALVEVLVRLSSIYMRLVEPLIPRQGSDVEVHRQSAVSTLVYEMVPGGRLVDRSPERWESSPRTVTINSLGFRDEEFQANGPHDGIRIICIGDSNTYGAAVSDEETWPRRLEETLLSEHGAATDVWNLGVSGYGIQQKLLLARRALREFAPDLLII